MWSMYVLCAYIFFNLFHDIVGKDEGKTNYMVKSASLSFTIPEICHRIMMDFSHPKF